LRGRAFQAVSAALALLALPSLGAMCQGGLDRAASLETSLVDPLFSIYFVRCHLDIDSENAALVGVYSLYADRTFFGEGYPGYYRGLSPLMGYRRFIWRGFYAEDQLLPMYAIYYKSYRAVEAEGFELWNEFHAGHRLDFWLGGWPLFLNFQGIAGLCVLKTYEPPPFAEVEKDKPAFYFLNFYVLPNILMGIQL
jgi:hypothetical protein